MLWFQVNREDKLPQKICDECFYKVELLYDFCNNTVQAEKQLLQWLTNVDTQGYAVTTILNQVIIIIYNLSVIIGYSLANT